MHWRVKNADNTLKGFHLDLQGMMGTKMPVALLNFVFKHTMLRKGMKKVKAAGFNGYTPEEIEQFGKDDLKVLSELLGDKQFFFGDDPNHLDLVAFSQIALVLNVDDSENGAKCPLKEFINADCTNLVGLVTRMKVNYIVYLFTIYDSGSSSEKWPIDFTYIFFLSPNNRIAPGVIIGTRQSVKKWS